MSVDTSTTPSPTTFSSSGRLSNLGAFTATGSESFTPFGLPPMIPYTLTGTERIVAANGDKLCGTVKGTGVNNSGNAHGMNTVTISGGTGRFADATGSFTETYTAHVTAYVGTTQSGPITTSIQGHLLTRVTGTTAPACLTVPHTKHPMPTPSSARLAGLPTACAVAPLTARIVGREIASVRWSLDGTPIRGRTLRQGRRYSAQIAVSQGVHELVARLTFVLSTQARPRTLRRKVIGCPIEGEDFRHALPGASAR